MCKVSRDACAVYVGQDGFRRVVLHDRYVLVRCRMEHHLRMKGFEDATHPVDLSDIGDHGFKLPELVAFLQFQFQIV